jgi:spore maturation protein CgeB
MNEINTILENIATSLPSVIFTINDAGLDTGGVLEQELIRRGCYIVNWYHDYPFYEELFAHRKMAPYKERIDFVSEESFVEEMISRGFTCDFLPLATDPLYFYPNDQLTYNKDVSFVGNSSAFFIDSIINEERSRELEKVLPVLGVLKTHYYQNHNFNVRRFLLANKSLWTEKTTLSDEELMFELEWVCGYFHRRDFVKKIAEIYGNRFMCYGDGDWKHIIPAELVSAEACYYDNLKDVYQRTKVNININRIQIRTAFTQRIFDCAASGAFIITDKRMWNDRFFKTSGNDIELVQFSSQEECFKLIDYYLAHDKERYEIVERLKRKTLSFHTYDNRIDSIVSTCKSKWTI